MILKTNCHAQFYNQTQLLLLAHHNMAQRSIASAVVLRFARPFWCFALRAHFGASLSNLSSYASVKGHTQLKTQSISDDKRTNFLKRTTFHWCPLFRGHVPLSLTPWLWCQGRTVSMVTAVGGCGSSAWCVEQCFVEQDTNNSRTITDTSESWLSLERVSEWVFIQ